MPDNVEQEVLTPEQEEKQFSAGYNRVAGITPKEEASGKDEPAKTQEPTKPVTQQPAVAPKKDEWEGAHPKIRATLETISNRLGAIDRLEQRLKTTEGRVGALQSALQTAHTVKSEGGAAPTQQQIQQASVSGKWQELMEAFPDFKEGLEERFAQIDARFGQQPKPFDVEGFRNELVGGVTTLVQNNARELREFAKLDRKHDAWEDTINTPQFSEWAFTDGPTPVERAQWNLLKAQSPEKADQYFHSFAQTYPEWWTAKGSLMASDQAKDAIALLDGYAQHDQQQNKAVQAKQQKQERNAQRLEAAITPQGAASPPGQPQIDEDAAFRKGFKKVTKLSYTGVG